MYIRNYGEYYSDKTKGELIIDIEALMLLEKTLWAQIVEEANTGGIALHDTLTQCRMEVAALIDQLRANEAKAKEEQEATDAQE
jgi:cytolysin (calcineurin-like family phosphatase)